MDPVEIFVICYSVIACCCSLAVIFTIMFFKRMRIGKFMPIIFYMSLCDLGQNITSAFGFPADKTSLCWAQGIMSQFFTLSCWFWTAILMYRIYSLVKFSQCTMSIRSMHMIVWGMATFLTLIPLVNSRYGAGPTQSQWCLWQERSGYPRWWTTVWAFASFFGWLFLLSCLMIVWQVIIYIEFRDSPMLGVIKRTYKKVYLYPLVMIGCWSLNCICDVIVFKGNDSTFTAISMICGISNGILSAFIFLWKSDEARRRWKRYLFPPPRQSEFDANVEPQVYLEQGTHVHKRDTEYDSIQHDFEMDDLDDIREYRDSMQMSVGNISMISMTDLAPAVSTVNPLRSVA